MSLDCECGEIKKTEDSLVCVEYLGNIFGHQRGRRERVTLFLRILTSSAFIDDGSVMTVAVLQPLA